MHFITQFNEARPEAVRKPRACVVVCVERQRGPCTLRVVGDGLSILKPDALITPLPEDVVVLHADGKACKPSGRFYVSVESFDPHHLLTDVF